MAAKKKAEVVSGSVSVSKENLAKFADLAKDLAQKGDAYKESASQLVEKMKPIVVDALTKAGVVPWDKDKMEQVGYIPKPRGIAITRLVDTLMAEYVNSDAVAAEVVHAKVAFKGDCTPEVWRKYIGATDGKPSGRPKTVYDAVGRMLRSAGYYTKMPSEKEAMSAEFLKEFFTKKSIDIATIAEALAMYSDSIGIQIPAHGPMLEAMHWESLRDVVCEMQDAHEAADKQRAAEAKAKAEEPKAEAVAS